MRESRTTVEYRGQDYTICVDDDTRLAIDDFVKRQKSHPENTTVTIESKLKSFRPYGVPKKSFHNRYVKGFFDMCNPDPPELLIAIAPVVIIAVLLIGIISCMREKNRDNMPRTRTDANKPSYEVIDFK